MASKLFTDFRIDLTKLNLFSDINSLSRNITMRKSVMLFVLVLSIIMSSQVGAQYTSNTLSLYDSEEEVTFIVEMEGRPVLPAIKLSGKTKYTKQAIESILSKAEFNASNDVNRVYESEKIPFRFDYGEGDSDTYKPPDTAKVFDMDMYEISR